MSFHCHSRGLLSAGPSRKRKEPSALKAGEQPVTSNRLLAGYMAYEFLTKGTILGRKFDPDRAEASPFPTIAAAQYKKPKTEAAPPEIIKKEHQIQSYTDVATILKTDKAQISGIVNPTQLARWLSK